MFPEGISNQIKLVKLFELVSRKRKILILTHNNPDPDSLASAFALKYIFKVRCHIDSIIAYGGIVGRAENRAMIKHLKMDVKPIADITIKNFSVIAMVDSQPGAGNNILPKSVLPTIVIDHHHPIRAKSRKVPFADVRTGYGSTSTIVTEYLKETDIPNIDRNVATALLYGISRTPVILEEERERGIWKRFSIFIRGYGSKHCRKLRIPIFPEPILKSFKEHYARP